MTWTRYIFKEHRTHVVPKRLAPALLHDLTTHHGAELEEFPADSNVRNTSSVSEWTIDLGGMWVGGSPSETVHLRGLTFTVPCHHVADVIARLQRLVPKRFASTGDLWYGLPHWHHATLLLPPQYHALLAKLVAVAVRADVLRATFDAGRAKIKTMAMMRHDGQIVRGIVPRDLVP